MAQTSPKIRRKRNEEAPLNTKMSDPQPREIEPLTDEDIRRLAGWLGIRHFRGVFMRDELDRNRFDPECGVVNLNTSRQPGSHWTSYWTSGNVSYYFDPYGDFLPPPELQKYLRGTRIYYNATRLQHPEEREPICGHLCLLILSHLSDGEDYTSILQRYD